MFKNLAESVDPVALQGGQSVMEDGSQFNWDAMGDAKHRKVALQSWSEEGKQKSNDREDYPFSNHVGHLEKEKQEEF